mgnify:CR=1 FL=1
MNIFFLLISINKNTTFIQIKNVPKVFTTFGTYPPRLFDISINRRSDHLYKQNKEHHCNRIHRSICNTRNITIYHGIGCRKTGRTGHTTGDGAQQIQQTDFKDQPANHNGNQHRHDSNGRPPLRTITIRSPEK